MKTLRYIKAIYLIVGVLQWAGAQTLGYVHSNILPVSQSVNSIVKVTDSAREQATKIVIKIQRADYEADRPTLKQLYEDLEPLVNDKEIGTKVRYWRGFAMWRRAFNGFNGSVGYDELAKDLEMALDEFNAALTKD